MDDCGNLRNRLTSHCEIVTNMLVHGGTLCAISVVAAITVDLKTPKPV